MTPGRADGAVGGPLSASARGVRQVPRGAEREGDSCGHGVLPSGGYPAPQEGGWCSRGCLGLGSWGSTVEAASMTDSRSPLCPAPYGTESSAQTLFVPFVDPPPPLLPFLDPSPLGCFRSVSTLSCLRSRWISHGCSIRRCRSRPCWRTAASFPSCSTSSTTSAAPDTGETNRIVLATRVGYERSAPM